MLEIIPGDIVKVQTNKRCYKTKSVILTPGNVINMNNKLFTRIIENGFKNILHLINHWERLDKEN